MKNHKKIGKKERSLIARMLAQGKKIRAIARELCRSPSTISEEVSRNQVWDGDRFVYESIIAQEEYERRKSKAGKREPLKNKWIYQYVINHLQLGWAPEQISGRLKIEHPLVKSRTVGMETIYRYIYDPENKDEILWEYLPRGQKKRKKQKGRSVHKSHIKARISISKRLARVNKRKEFGHFEGDSVEGRRSVGDGIHTEVERVSRMFFAVKVKRINSEETIRVQTEIFEKLPSTARKSVTLDNGRENHLHMRLNKILNMKTYFCHPYASYERGTNENTNGLLRRYLPKQTDFTGLTQDELDEIVSEINNRPRKVLKYKTAQEVFTSLINNCSDST
ncbi:IS30 family transposase [Candidatus Roizmanbacteria bacterium CG_4_9_14_0_8_um_filter_34_12]|uniref:IS30 family transposase n=1 Tax=Candidatus Roizmanbacteria bacterium CG_4_9_14_0_8_um_filter_34_12 TaxID=1974840 RepID=A0A2M8DDX2_9BACT|nr:MAG: IS30 family transposase [Candidatus Roizmanbacteria bacterium CG_4_9_14_3_um_filter_36_11]PJB89199.1 MAG: IS30 family transposase [Candidatus Roizmanbacteria bacterium CG_4_9_14_0_8_um_filter_34_12]